MEGTAAVVVAKIKGSIQLLYYHLSRAFVARLLRVCVVLVCLSGYYRIHIRYRSYVLQQQCETRGSQLTTHDVLLVCTCLCSEALENVRTNEPNRSGAQQECTGMNMSQTTRTTCCIDRTPAGTCT